MASVKTPLASFAPNIAPHINTFGTSQERDTIVLEKPQPNTQSSDKSPTTLGTKRKMSFGVGSFNSPNGMPHGINYGGPNGSRISQPTYSPKTAAPSIYTAVYSGISVYETIVNGIAVMRRRSDSWLNATQILKVAGVDKGKRTKVLEKEILSGEHEKVQGGYGRYQGTWINYKRGREFCRQYGVEDLLRSLLEYDMGQDGAQPGEGSRIETPTKEQAMAAQRKKLMFNGAENRPTLQTPNMTFFQNISSTAANAVSAISKARFDSPNSRPGSGVKRPSSVRPSSQQMGDSQPQAGSQQSMQSDSSLNNDQFQANRSNPYFKKPNRSQSALDGEPPRKRARPSSSAEPFSQNTNGDYERSLRERSPTEPNESFMYSGYVQPGLDGGVVGLLPLPAPTSHSDLEKQGILASLFLDPSRDDLSDVPGLDNLNGEDFDIPIDNGAHTALHWAASLAKPTLLKALVARGASIFRVNGGGETALMRAARTTNNLDHNSFPELLELLGPTIEMRDNRGQTVLHHIAVTSAIKGRSSSCRYYLDSLLAFVVRQGSAPNSQQESFHPDPGLVKKPIGLARFMSEIVNAQDIAGDTALNLAARINNRSIIQQLLEVGANPSIPNRGGLKPLDFGVGGEIGAEIANSSQNSLSSSQKTTSENRVGDSSKQLMDSLKTLVQDTELSFRSELQAKQSLIDQAQTKLRELSSSFTNERRNLSDLEAKTNERATLKHQIANLFRLNAEKRAFLATTGPAPAEDVSIGDADTGLTIDAAKLRSISPSDPSLNSAVLPTPDQEAYLKSLPPSHVLHARVRAYRFHNKNLESKKQALKTKSAILEKKLRRIVALSTGIDEAKVDETVARLDVAIQSEEGEEVDTGRLREFLRRLEDGGE